MAKGIHIAHKIFGGVTKKFCATCKKWLKLNDFTKDKYKPDGKHNRCKNCRKKKRGKKCAEPYCTKLAFDGQKYCNKHNPKICKFKGCKAKTGGRYEFCELHDVKNHCKFKGCKRRKKKGGYCNDHNKKRYCKYDGCKSLAKIGDYCRKHGPKTFCKIDGCEKIAKYQGLCTKHSCDGNIDRCAQSLLRGAQKRDKAKKQKCTLRNVDIVDLYHKNKKRCYWCKHTLKLKLSDRFNLGNISIDKINGKLPYSKDNAHVTCSFCNFARNATKPKRWKWVMKILRGKKHTINFTKYNPKKKFINAFHKWLGSDISVPWVREQLRCNDFRCAITNLPIYITTEQKFPWGPSIDRIDNKKGHMKDNCQVTCQFVNTGKNRLSDKKFKKWFAKRFPKINIKKVIYPKDYKKDLLKIRYPNKK